MKAETLKMFYMQERERERALPMLYIYMCVCVCGRLMYTDFSWSNNPCESLSKIPKTNHLILANTRRRNRDTHIDYQYDSAAISLA
jgi:hypothetical protein